GGSARWGRGARRSPSPTAPAGINRARKRKRRQRCGELGPPPPPLGGEGWGGGELRESFCVPPPWPSPASGGGDAPSAERQFAASTETCSEFFAFRPALSLGRTAIRRTQNNSALLRTSLRRAGILH